MIRCLRAKESCKSRDWPIKSIKKGEKIVRIIDFIYNFSQSESITMLEMYTNIKPLFINFYYTGFVIITNLFSLNICRIAKLF